MKKICRICGKVTQGSACCSKSCGLKNHWKIEREKLLKAVRETFICGDTADCVV